MFPFRVKCDSQITKQHCKCRKTVSITVKCDLVFNSVFYLIEYEAVIRASSISSNSRQEGLSLVRKHENKKALVFLF